MNIEIELLGYKGRITYIIPRLALLPWQPEDQLLVYVDFEKPYPASLMAIAVNIPVKDYSGYSTEEFIDMVQFNGQVQLARYIGRHIQEQKMFKEEEQRKAELNALVKSLEEKFG